jgi:hypothetical protein
MGRALAVALSLSTLWFIGIWSDLLPFLYASDRLPIGALPCWNDFLGVVLNVLCLAAAFLLLGRLHARLPPSAAAAGEWLFLASFVVPLNVVRNHFHLPFEDAIASLPRAALLGLAVVGGLAAIAVAARWRARIVAGTVAALAILSPLVGITFAQAGWALAQAGGRMQCTAGAELAPPLPGRPGVRVLWVVFDELEQYAAFEGRPDGLALPALDRLRGEGLAATAAVPPGDRTERSMPGVLSGRPVADAVLTGRNQLSVRFDGAAQATPWRGADTVLSDARGLGVNTAVAGFFLPYCALAGNVLTSCRWEACVTCGRMVGAYGDTVAASMWNQLSELVPGYSRRRHLAAYRALRDASVELAVDPAVGFALLHLPVPHAPPIYDARRNAFSYERPDGPGYFDNLALADRTLGELRASMEQAGTWRSTAVMVFGDHGRRDLSDGVSVAHREVPLLVSLPGESRPVSYTSPVDLSVLRGLTTAILQGRVNTTGEAVAWLDANRWRRPVD